MVARIAKSLVVRKPVNAGIVAKQHGSRFRVSRALLLSIDGRSPQDANAGYILWVALAFGIIVTIGVAALAGRSFSSFFGAVNASKNQEAREVAESALVEFQNAMNKERNRALLVRGTNQSWSSADENPCTGAYNASDPKTPIGTVPPVQDDIDKFKIKTAADTPSTLVSLSSDPGKSFYVEEIRYYTSTAQQRSEFTTTPAAVERGASRSLIRVTVLGRVTRNGITSVARVTREFEVVPKCCDRAFGRNTYAATNWGRDANSAACKIQTRDGSTGNGIYAGLNGGDISGTNNVSLLDPLGKPITKAICYSGTDVAGGSECKNGVEQASSASFSGDTNRPPQFYFCWSGSAYQALTSGNFSCNGNITSTNTSTHNSANGNHNVDINIDLSGDKYIYYNTRLKQVRLCNAQWSNGNNSSLQTISNCTNLAGVNSANATDPCYTSKTTLRGTAVGGEYGSVVNCRLEKLVFNNSRLSIDTTAAQLNLFFDQDKALTGTGQPPYEYMQGGGNTQYRSVNCRSASAGFGSGSGQAVDYESSAPTPLCKTEPTTGTGAGGFFQKCSSISSGCPTDFDTAELLNIYTDGSGKLTINGTASTAAFNVYAPYANVEILGGGNADPNFMGRLYTNALKFTGNAKVIANSSDIPACQTPGVCNFGVGIPQVDWIARSYSHASGFGF